MIRNKKGLIGPLAKLFNPVTLVVIFIIWALVFFGSISYDYDEDCLEDIGTKFCEYKNLEYISFNKGVDYFKCGEIGRSSWGSGQVFYFTDEELSECLIENQDKDLSLSTTYQTNNYHLCNVFTPYVNWNDMEEQCSLVGGSWDCRSDYVGCFNMGYGILDCSSSTSELIKSQCESKGGTYLCDSDEVSCTY